MEGRTLTFSDPDAYAAAFGDLRLNLTITDGGAFRARLSRLKLKHLEAYWCCENLSRVAFVSFPSDRIFLSFPFGLRAATFGGIALRNDDMVFHGRGERGHQRSNGECWWGLISMPSEQWVSCSAALAGQPIASPPASRILHPSRTSASTFQSLCRQARKLAETRQHLIEIPEIARALEQQILHALITCVAGMVSDGYSQTRARRAAVIVRFEEELSKHIDQKLNMRKLCEMTGVTERTLRQGSAELLGMSPARYILLQRLNRARAALRRADPSKTTVAEIAQNYQLVELGRFAVMYRALFGESPSDTLRCDRQGEDG